MRGEMVLWRQATKAQAIPEVCCAIEVKREQTLASTQVYKWTLFFLKYKLGKGYS